MPVVALVGAAASVAAGVTAIGAATTIGATFMAGLQIAGGVLGGLGALTGNKKLMKIGAVAGIVGGIGSAFSGTLFGDSGASAAGASSMADGMINNPSAYVGSASQSINNPSAYVGSIDGGAVSSSAKALTPTTSSVIDTGASNASVVGGPKTGGGMLDLVKNAPSKIENFMTQNPALTKTAGGAFKGLLDSYSQQQALSERAREEQKLLDERRRKANDSVMNQQPLMRTI